MKIRKGEIRIYKFIEDIRRERTDLTQTQFANEIGMSFRSYQERLKGDRPKWFASEIIKASQFNNGEILVEMDGKTYQVKIKAVE